MSALYRQIKRRVNRSLKVVREGRRMYGNACVPALAADMAKHEAARALRQSRWAAEIPY